MVLTDERSCHYGKIRKQGIAIYRLWVICGYVYEGEELPADFICPICKPSAEDFEPLK